MVARALQYERLRAWLSTEISPYLNRENYILLKL